MGILAYFLHPLWRKCLSMASDLSQINVHRKYAEANDTVKWPKLKISQAQTTKTIS